MMELEILKQRAKAFDYLFDAVVVTDLQGIIVDWNKGSENLYGYTKEEAIGKPVNILHFPDDTERITSEVISAVAEHGKWTGEIRMLHKDQSIGWIESMCVPIFDSNNQMIGALGVNRDITSRKKETERLEHLAHYDQLTSIPNRYLFFDRIRHLIAQSKRHDNMFALLYVDLDNFKKINDSKGHTFGDQVLEEVALCLKQSIRKSDTVARIGGDEFVLLLENVFDKKAVLATVETLREVLNKEYIVGDEAILITSSIGVAIYPDEGTTADALLATADKNMYEGKHRHKFSST